MNICVVGWHYWTDLYNKLNEIKNKYPVFIVAHRKNDMLNNFNHKLIPNRGLEWGAYHYYVMRIWDGKSNILFQHDDIQVDDAGIYDRIANIDWCDQVYIFGNEDEQELNRGVHGRAMFCSAKLLGMVRGEGGIWYDRDNRGNVRDDKPATGYHYNEAVVRWRDRMRAIRKAVCDKELIIPGFQPARRGIL